MMLVDLSHSFDPALYREKAGRAAQLSVRPVTTIESHGVRGTEITFNDHIGTHLDAPAHLVPGGKSIDQLPLETFYGPAVILDLPRGPNGAVTRADLESARPQIEPRDIVIVSCGWSEKLGAPDYASHHPYISADAATWLVQTGVRMVGMDVQSIDLPHSLRDAGFRYTSLRILLEADVPVLLNLRNLTSLHGRRVTVVALPIGFAGCDGAPARAVALID